MYSSLEQFEVFPLISLFILNNDFSFTNSAMATLLAVFSFLFLFFTSTLFEKTRYKLNRYYLNIISVYKVSLGMLIENAGKNTLFFFSFIFTILLSLLLINVLGMIPYNFTPTSHLLITFYLSFITFLIINIIGIQIHGTRLFGLFLPQGAPFALSFLLIPIELISYIFRVISLSVRLFANMMAGHTLLKVIGGFSWTMLKQGGFIFLILHLVPLIIVYLLIGLELGVAFIQAYVFTILSCIYLSDVIVLH